MTSSGALQLANGVAGVERATGDQLLGLRLPGTVPAWFDQGLVLSEGDVLRGSVLAVTGDNLRFASDLLGPITVPFSAIAALRLAPAPIGDPVPSAFAGAVLANGDRLEGRLVSLDGTKVGIDTGSKTMSIPRARVTLVVLRAPAAPAKRQQVLRFANGDRLAGTLAAPAAGVWELTSAFGAVRFPLANARGLWSEGPNLVPLGTLTPSDGAPAAIDAAADGGSLVAGSQRWDRGLVCRAPSRLEYDIPAGATTLVAEVALAAGAGSAIFRVLVDGTSAFDSGAIAPGAAAKPLRVPLAGRAKLTLVVEPGPDCDALGARAVWGWATLMK